MLRPLLLPQVKTRTSETVRAWVALKCEGSPAKPEGVGGPLTEFDSEESPLSTVQAATRRKQTEMVGFKAAETNDARCVQ